MTDKVKLDDVEIHIPHEVSGSPRPRRSGNSSNTEPEERYWNSPCGGRWSVACIRFLFMYSVLTGSLVFFSVALYQAESCESSNLWQSLVLLILGVMIPSPSVK